MVESPSLATPAASAVRMPRLGVGPRPAVAARQRVLVDAFFDEYRLPHLTAHARALDENVVAVAGRLAILGGRT